MFAKLTNKVDLDLRGMKFVRANPPLRELILLQGVLHDPEISQRSLARRAGISATMANHYLARLSAEEFVAVQGENQRNFRYGITERGRRRLRELTGQFGKEVARLYGQIKGEYAARLESLADGGLRKAVLFGAGSTGELVYQASLGTDVRIAAVVDSATEKWGAPFGDLRVEPPANLRRTEPAAVLVASTGHAEEIVRQCREEGLDRDGIDVVIL